MERVAHTKLTAPRGALLRLHLDCRKLPKPTQETVGRTTDHEQLSDRVECHQHRVTGFTHARPTLRGRPQLLRTLRFGPALFGQRTNRAPRGSGGTYRRPQFHERLVPVPRPVGIDELAGSCPKAGVRGVRQVEESGQDTPRVPIHGGHHLAISDARDRPSAVLADPGERLETPRVLRKHPTEPLPHDEGRAPQIPGPRIVTEPLPCLQYGLLIPLGKRVDRGKTLHPAVVVRNRGLHACLLEHDLGNPHTVGFPTLSPREVTAMGVVVLQEEPSESVRVWDRHHLAAR